MRATQMLVLLALGAGWAVERFGPETWFVPDALPQKVSVTGNPLDYCGERIGLDVRNVELPRAWEGGYRFCCRFPIIDAVANRPLYIKQWAEENADSVGSRHRRKGIGAIDYALGVLRGVAEPLAPARRDLSPGGFDFPSALGKTQFTDKFRAVLSRFYLAVESAYAELGAWREMVAEEDVRFLGANPGYYLAPDGRKMPELTGDNSTQLEFISYARRMDFAPIFNSARMLAGAVREYLRRTEKWARSEFVTDQDRASEGFSVMTPIGRFTVAGFGRDTLREDAAVLIELGGDDVFLNNAGGSLPIPNIPWSVSDEAASLAGRLAVCIDHSGNDRYVSDSNCAQGFGFLGAGFLVDMAGNDLYQARHFSQGAGILGVGALWDLGGNDIYDGQAFVQGAGMFGLGMLLDDAGNDQYDCATLGQGAATTLGLGVLSDLGGNDRYQLAVKPGGDALGGLPGYGQGGALSFRPYPWEGKLTTYGGVGLLVDDYGDDTYETKGWCDQGGSYIMSLGALVDNHGNDHYIAGTGQGSGIHITNGVLVDKEGDDTYEGGFRSGGSAGDRSVSMLLDYAGNDVYQSKTSSYGTGCKPFSYSLMIDYQGADRYVCAEPKAGVTFNNWESFGGVWPESDPASWPYAICMDLGGRDDYQVKDRANDTDYVSFGHGIHLDKEWGKGDVIGRIESPLPPYPGVPQVTGMPLAPNLKDVLELKSPDLFHRFQAIGRIAALGSDVVPTLVSVLRESEHRQFNRDVLECLNYLLVEKKVLPEQVPLLASLLKARDPEVRTVMADNFGVFRFPEARFDLMAAALSDSEPAVRRFALRSLVTLKARNFIPRAGLAPVLRVESLVVDDPSPDVRRAAVRYLSRPFFQPVNAPWPIDHALLTDSVSSVQCAAAEALWQIAVRVGTRSRLDSLAVGLLRQKARSRDVYVQRACGRALAELGKIEGVGLLIKSLSFPSIDAFYNYDRNVPNSIAAYCNFDLPESTRYQQARWQEWFDANKGQIHLKSNVAAYRAVTAVNESLGTAAEALQIKAYEDLLAKYPTYQSIKRTLAGKLNAVAWNMVTAAPSSPQRDLKAGLKYARRCVELSDDPNYWDTLVEALVANGLDAEALKLTTELTARFPGNALFTDRLKKLKN